MLVIETVHGKQLKGLESAVLSMMVLNPSKCLHNIICVTIFPQCGESRTLAMSTSTPCENVDYFYAWMYAHEICVVFCTDYSKHMCYMIPVSYVLALI